MRDLARKLMLIEGDTPESKIPSAIMGDVGNLAQSLNLKPQFRIGLWPCVGETDPDIAMGLVTALGYLLERWQDVRVYRIFAELEGEPENYEWSIARSQFDVDDWMIDDLDENIAIWGRLEQSENDLILGIEIENDLAEDSDEPATLEYRADELGALIGLLPKVADDIAANLNVSTLKTISLAYSADKISDESIKPLLKQVFYWERDLFLLLWGREWPDDKVLEDEEALLSAGELVGGEFGAWCVASAVARAMLPGYSLIGELLISRVQDIVNSFAESKFPAILLSRALYGLAYVDEAYDLLETEVGEHPTEALSWLALADLYRASRRFADAAETFQRAMEAGGENAQLYINYASLLLIMDYEGWTLEDYVLIDPDEKQSDLPIWEAVEAYQRALRFDPDNVDALYLQLMQIADNNLEYERFWPGFERLVRLDETGDKVRNLIDSLFNFEDISPLFTTLRQAIKDNPGRADMHLNLAAGYLLDEDGSAARSELEKARQLSDDPLVHMEIDRLLLAADDPDFEARLGELTDIVSAGKALDTEDVEFLEDVIEKVPTFADGYLLLAKAYVAWDEPGTALETLLDGQKYLPDDPDILEMLARLLWDSGEHDLAFDYLNKGIALNPNHVPLLSLMGQYLFEDGEEEQAKVFLVKAELISPRDPALGRARLNIARILGQQEIDENYDQDTDDD